jgi:hypothetical protein
VRIGTALWLARRELSVRWTRAVLAAGVAAAAAGLVGATELLSRSREEAIALELDAIGPPLVVVPRTAPPGALATYDLGPGRLPEGTAEAARRALGAAARSIEERLVVARDGGPLLVGIGPAALPGIPPGGAEAGSVAAERFGPGAEVEVSGRRFRVAQVRPSTAGVEDLAVFVRIDELSRAIGSPAPNELRVHLAPGVDPAWAAARLEPAVDGRVVRRDRGEVADGGAQRSLAEHRLALYALTAAIAAVTLLIAAHLDAAERRGELAALQAIGAGRGFVLAAVLARSGGAAGAGALGGILAAAALAAATGGTAAAVLARAAPGAAVLIAAAVALGLAAAVPTAIASARRDPVAELQESSS